MISGRTPLLTAIAKVFNVLGLVYVTLPARIALAGYIALRRQWWHLAAFTAAIVLSEVLIGSLKGIYDRARPPGPLVATSGASFPSGHAIAASVTVVAAVIALVPAGRRRALWGAAAVAFSIVMGLSRRMPPRTSRPHPHLDLPHLRRILAACERHHNDHRPHMALSSAAPLKPLLAKVTDLEAFPSPATRPGGRRHPRVLAHHLQ